MRRKPNHVFEKRTLKHFIEAFFETKKHLHHADVMIGEVMDCVLTIDVKIQSVNTVEGTTGTVVMLAFEGSSDGPNFTGKTIGPCVDTQRYNTEGKGGLSARYMLEGTDNTGEKCRIFIENNGPDLEHCIPTILTDSKALSYLNSAKLHSIVTPVDDGVCIKIYKEEA